MKLSQLDKKNHHGEQIIMLGGWLNNIRKKKVKEYMKMQTYL